MKKTPSTLYHYCSIESFFNIIKSKSIWLSNSSQMNDSNENTLIEQYFSIIEETFTDKKYEEFLKDAFDIYKVNNNPPFIFCLSESKDLLSQWRGYSQDGHGISIGFKTKNLTIKCNLPTTNIDANETLGIVKVEYINKSQKRSVIEFCSMIKDKFDRDVYHGNYIYLSFELALSMINCSLTFKNLSFKEENEWRIIHTPAQSYELQSDNLSSIKFRLNKNRITTYYEYCFKEKFNSNAICEIILGPKCQMSIKDVKQFLEHNNLKNTKISISKSSYR